MVKILSVFSYNCMCAASGTVITQDVYVEIVLIDLEAEYRTHLVVLKLTDRNNHISKIMGVRFGETKIS